MDNNSNLRNENLILQKKLREIELNNLEVNQFKQENDNYKRKFMELKRFKDKFLLLIEKYNIDKKINNHTEEGLNILEVKLIELESYLQDLIKKNKILTENLSLKIKNSLITRDEIKKGNETLWIQFSEKKPLVEKPESTKNEPKDKSSKIDNQDVSDLISIESDKRMISNINIGRSIQTKFIQTLNKDIKPDLLNKTSEISPYNINNPKREKRIQLGDEIDLHRSLNHSPKFFQENKDITCNHQEYISRHRPDTYTLNHNNKIRLVEIEKDIGYFSIHFIYKGKNIIDEINHYSNSPNNRSFSNIKNLNSKRQVIVPVKLQSSNLNIINTNYYNSRSKSSNHPKDKIIINNNYLQRLDKI